jgi:nucleoside-diphosphate-sugar epimerase
MHILITGAAGNMGSLLARHLLASPHRPRLLVHRTPLPFDASVHANVSVCRADLGDPATLAEACRDTDCIVHFAGRLFAPRPEKFLPRTNVGWVENLVAAARAAGVRKVILVSFPHVEGESSPERPATGRMDGTPGSVHARTRLLAEKRLFAACDGTAMVPVVLRVGAVYARGVKVVEAARWLLRHRLLAVWRRPTWEHLLALPDFHAAALAAIESPHVAGVYNLGDDQPVTLQEFLDTAAAHWGLPKPRRLPRWCFPLAGAGCETFAALFGTAAPLTRDFVRIGMASAWADTSRMKRELLPRLAYPSLREGLPLL